jgi:hypothetical protein
MRRTQAHYLGDWLPCARGLLANARARISTSDRSANAVVSIGGAEQQFLGPEGETLVRVAGTRRARGRAECSSTIAADAGLSLTVMESVLLTMSQIHEPIHLDEW